MVHVPQSTYISEYSKCVCVWLVSKRGFQVLTSWSQPQDALMELNKQLGLTTDATLTAAAEAMVQNGVLLVVNALGVRDATRLVLLLEAIERAYEASDEGSTVVVVLSGWSNDTISATGSDGAPLEYCCSRVVLREPEHDPADPNTALEQEAPEQEAGAGEADWEDESSRWLFGVQKGASDDAIVSAFQGGIDQELRVVRLDSRRWAATEVPP